MKKAIFLDRDGVLNKSEIIDGKPHAPLLFKNFHVFPDVKKTLESFKKKGFLNIVITNQPNLSPLKGTLDRVELNKMHQHLYDNYHIDEIFICPHVDEDNCDCRKPKIGNLVLASNKFNIDLKESYFVGDRWRDVECSNNANLKHCFLIDNNYNEKKPYGLFTRVKILSEVLIYL